MILDHLRRGIRARKAPTSYKTRNGAQDAHEAIRPTDILAPPGSIKASLSRDQYRLYKLIYDRFVSSQMDPRGVRHARRSTSG